VIYRQDSAKQIDFPSWALRWFAQPGDGGCEAPEPEARDTEFLANFLTRSGGPKEQPDAVIIADRRWPRKGACPGCVPPGGDLKYPVFYMNYNLNPT